LHFGVGSNTKIATIEVAWPSGKKEVYRDLATDTIYTIEEDRGVKQSTPFTVDKVEEARKAPAAK
jgi:hypothetical protein